MAKKTNMKDKIIIVHYIGVERIDDGDIGEYLDEISENFSFKNDDTVYSYFVPVMDSNEIRIECINPVEVNAEKYAEVVRKLNEANEMLKKAIKDINEKNVNNETSN